LEGELCGIYVDSNYDHWFDDSYLITENRDTLFMADKNKNGFMEVKIVEK
jgi:hypothetical protein